MTTRPCFLWHSFGGGVCMSLFPCDECKLRFVGRAAYLYEAIVEGVERLSKKKRLCASCLLARFNEVEKWADSVTESGIEHNGSDDRSCALCGSKQGRRLAFFSTSFDPAGERADYFAVLCPACAAIEGLQPSW